MLNTKYKFVQMSPKDRYKNVHSSTICNNAKLKTI